MALVIEDQDLNAANMSAEELRLEIAIMLYQQEKFSMGKASKFAGIESVNFQKELAKRRIPVNYDEEELRKDMETLGLNPDDGSK